MSAACIVGPIRAAGDGGLIATLADASGQSSPAIVRAVTDALDRRLAGELGDGFIDLVPASDSVLVLFDPGCATPARMRSLIRAAVGESTASEGPPSRQICLPVYYGDDVAWDLPALAEHAGLSPQTVIAAHSEATYTVQAIGFAPGFAYLGGLDARLALPRLATPRTRVPAGAVAVAERRSAVYPAESPGGWRIIGRCPTPLFDPLGDPPLAYAVGDTVRFEPVDRARFLALGGDLADAP